MHRAPARQLPDGGLALVLGVWGSGFRGLGFRVQGLGLRAWGLGFRVWGLGFGA